MKNPHTVIHSQIVSEKGTDITEKNNQYLFRVASSANRIEVKQAVEKIFNVKVKSVQVMNRKGKIRRRGAIAGRTSSSRRAVVRLEAGQTINVI
ncbi:MAG: 50S ribosomal protein L23 [Chlamydiae bacterium]|nr:MAG: 50S ribosomal protein L23 [Chlamydiota bacterium]